MATLSDTESEPATPAEACRQCDRSCSSERGTMQSIGAYAHLYTKSFACSILGSDVFASPTSTVNPTYSRYSRYATFVLVGERLDAAERARDAVQG